MGDQGPPHTSSHPLPDFLRPVYIFLLCNRARIYMKLLGYKTIFEKHYPMGLSIWVFTVTFFLIEIASDIKVLEPCLGNESAGGGVFGDAGD